MAPTLVDGLYLIQILGATILGFLEGSWCLAIFPMNGRSRVR